MQMCNFLIMSFIKYLVLDFLNLMLNILEKIIQHSKNKRASDENQTHVHPSVILMQYFLMK